MIKHQSELMPRENNVNIDPLAMDDESVLSTPLLTETSDQDSAFFTDSQMVNEFVATYLSIF
jgi:hypothetical protein